MRFTILPSLLATVIVISACGSEVKPTRALVEVYSDFGEELASLKVEVSELENPERRKTEVIPVGTRRASERYRPNFLLSFAVAPHPGREQSSLLVEVAGANAEGDEVVWARAVTPFVRANYIIVPVNLARLCTGVKCTDTDQTCSDEILDADGKGQCAPIVPVDDSPTTEGSLRPDASADAGVMDATLAEDGGARDGDPLDADPENLCSVTCGSNMRCEFDGGAHCECERGFQQSPDGCINVDDCAREPCGAGNACIDGVDDYTCTCADGLLQAGPKLCVARFVGLSAGGDKTCALRADGSVGCWGSGRLGQLGNGETGNSRSVANVAGLSNVSAVSAGDVHACALLKDGSVACWGNNSNGELGNGNTTNSSVPVNVLGLSGALKLAGGSGHHCAIRGDHTAVCWGENREGQLGDGASRDSPTPVIVSGLSGVENIAAGVFHTCAQLSDGTVYCWGSNFFGQLGDPTGPSTTTPVRVSSVTNATNVACGANHACALRDDRSVVCWGDNSDGQLGNSTVIAANSAPIVVSDLRNVSHIAAGYSHSCARHTNGTVSCWGSGIEGQLGNGTRTSATAPVSVNDLGDATSVSAGRAHSCALQMDGNIVCWGSNTAGQLGNDMTGPHDTPVKVVSR